MTLAILAGPPGTLRTHLREHLKGQGFRTEPLEDGTRPSMIEATSRLVQRHGPPALLVTLPEQHDAAPFGEMSRERWQRLLLSHLGLTVDACAAVVPHMVRANRGTVVTTVSSLALAGVRGESYLAAASGAIVAFTKSLALEVAGKGVRVNGIVVGRVGRELQAKDIADSILFLHHNGDFFVGQMLRATAGAT